MLAKKEYEISSNIVKQPVRRYYSDIKWLHSALKFDYPTMVIPPMPDNNKTSINNFFKSLLLLDQLNGSYTLHFFVSCVSQQLFSEFKIKKQLKSGNSSLSALLKDPSKLLTNNSLTTKDLDDLVNRAGKLDDIPIVKNKNFANLSSDINEVTGYSSLIFNEIRKSMDKLQKQISEVSKNFNHIAELFGNLALQSNKISSVAEEYSDPKLNYLNIEEVYLKYKTTFYNSSKIIRCCI